uniref:AB hydrolase-1 domain-containing protein n=1 Tax=Leersia perrieri TaxID=77586 RepID=A0A0D9XI15_9ORYZ
MDALPHMLLLLFLLLLASCPFSWIDGHALPPLHHHAGADGIDLHPIVLVPGDGCSQLDAELSEEYEPSSSAPARCGARKGKGWFRLWMNGTALRDPDEASCYADQLRMMYDPDLGDYRNVAGVQTHVVSFGTTHGFGPYVDDGNDPLDPKRGHCFKKLTEALEVMGYKEAENLFGAPYDFRYSPAPLGMHALIFSFFMANMTRLIEHASRKNGGKPVILLTHSNGGSMAVEFLTRSEIPWREKFIKHLIMISAGAGGIVVPLQSLPSSSNSDDRSPLTLAETMRSYGSVFSALPSPKVFGEMPLVVTRHRNYSAYDIPEFLEVVGFSGEDIQLYRTRALPVTLGFRAPRVPMTAIYGAGVPTPEQLVYWDGDFSKEPEVVYGDGDDTVNLASALALDMVVGQDPEQSFFKAVKTVNATHLGILAEEFAIERVISEILEANHATYEE